MIIEEWKVINVETDEPIYDYIVYRLYRKKIVRASLLDKILYILITDDERI